MNSYLITCTVQSLIIGTDRSKQTVQNHNETALKEHSNLDLNYDCYSTILHLSEVLLHC